MLNFLSSRHLRVRDISNEWFRAVLHQLRERKASTDLHSAHAQERTGNSIGELLKQIMYPIVCDYPLN
jgi:hypothetical protein